MIDCYEIDKLVALHVMKWKPVYHDDDVIVAWDIGKGRELFFTCPFESDNEWSPSTNISDTWIVVERLANVHFSLHCLSGDYIATFDNGEHEANSAPLAICLAALKSVGVDVECT